MLHLRFYGYGRGEWTDSAVRRYVTDAGPLLSRLHRLTRSDVTTRNRRKAAQLAADYDALETDRADRRRGGPGPRPARPRRQRDHGAARVPPGPARRAGLAAPQGAAAGARPAETGRGRGGAAALGCRRGPHETLISVICTASFGGPSAPPVVVPAAAIRSSRSRPLVTCAEHGVVRRDVAVLEDDEELRAVGARPGVGHRQGPRGYGPSRRQVLLAELVAGAAGAGAARVAALQHPQALGWSAGGRGCRCSSPARPGGRTS